MLGVNKEIDMPTRDCDLYVPQTTVKSRRTLWAFKYWEEENVIGFYNSELDRWRCVLNVATTVRDFDLASEFIEYLLEAKDDPRHEYVLSYYAEKELLG